jgi:hypothetical protein
MFPKQFNSPHDVRTRDTQFSYSTISIILLMKHYGDVPGDLSEYRAGDLKE